MKLSEMPDNQILDQLSHLKGMTVRLGAIHEAQVLQLQMWPLVVFPFSTATTCKIDVENRKVIFRVSTVLDKDPTGPANDKAVKTLTEWVRKILWDDTEVSINWKNIGEKNGNIRKSKKSLKNRRR